MGLFRNSAGLVLKSIICTNCILHGIRDPLNNSGSYSITEGTSIQPMLWSMFRHASAEHLISNMVPLYMIGRDVFQESDSAVWRNGLSVILVFFGSGVFGFFANFLLSRYLRNSWQEKLNAAKDSVSLKGWLSRITVNPILRSIASVFVHITAADEYIALKKNQWVYRIGASGGVYGIIGAKFYTLLNRKFHPVHGRSPYVWFSILFYACDIIGELSMIPTDLKALKSKFFSSDNIDHVAHFGGFLFGFASAVVLNKLSEIWHNKKRLSL